MALPDQSAPRGPLSTADTRTTSPTRRPLLQRILLGGLGALALLVGGFLLWPSRIDPVAWTPGAPFPATGPLAPNDALRAAVPIGTGQINTPEDVVFDTQGRMYVGSRDLPPPGQAIGKGDINPRIERVTFNTDGSYSVERFAELPGGGPLDLRFDRQGNLIVASWGQGVVSIAPDGIATTLLADGTDIEGTPFGFADGLAIAADGRIFVTQLVAREFSVGIGEVLDVLSGRDNGRLIEFNPATGESRVLLSNLSYANGVALAPDESYLLVADQLRYRILRYWLTGPQAGTHDVWSDRLPGLPHNITLDDQGVLWVALTQNRPGLPHDNAWLMAQLAKLPDALIAPPAVPAAERDPNRRGVGSVIALDLQGNPLLSLQNPPLALDTLSTAVYHDGFVYLGSLGGGPVFRVPLPERPLPQP